MALIVAKEWFFYQAWAGLPESIREGHARIPPWRERLAADPGRSLDFLRALDDLADRFGGEPPAPAGLAGPGRLLDERGDTPPAVAMFDLMMLVENDGGAAWTGSRLTAWLRSAGLTGVELRRGAGPIAVLRATAPGP